MDYLLIDVYKRQLYSSRLVKLPVPRFLVFCNGRMPDQAEKIVLKLSDSFEKRTGEPELELKVTVLNINACLLYTSTYLLLSEGQPEIPPRRFYNSNIVIYYVYSCLLYTSRCV